MITDASKVQEYIENFYRNKPPKEHFSGQVPVSLDTTNNAHNAVTQMFRIVEQAFLQKEDKNAAQCNQLRHTLLAYIKPIKQELYDCIFEANSVEEGEKCADNYIRRICTEGFAYARDLSNKI